MTTSVLSDTELRYPSLEAMRVAHRSLLRRFQRTDAQESMVDDIADFLQHAQFTGAVLGSERERNEGQSLLDYWVAALYRLRYTAPDAELAPFDVETAQHGRADAPCPYKGLSPFSENDARNFYGRQVVIDQLCERLRVGNVVVVAGPNGCGKTSLIQAGLLPVLEQGTVPGSDAWQVFSLVVSATNPLRSLVRAVRVGLDEASRLSDISKLRADPAYLATLFQSPSLLVVDQFEDLFPESGEALTDDALAFISALAALVKSSGVRCRVVLIRSDRVLAPADGAEETSAADEDPVALLLGKRFRLDVPDLGTRELYDAVLQPAELAGLRFVPLEFQDKEAMVADLVRALVGIPVVPPLLQFILMELWDHRVDGRITWQSYRDVLWDPRRRRTNVGWAVGNVAERVYAQAASVPGLQDAIRALIMQLVKPEAGSDLTLLRIRRSNVPADSLMSEALDRLARARLLRFTADETDPGAYVELVHVALARYWRELDQWLIQARIRDALLTRLNADIDQWKRHNQSVDLLWPAVKLESLADLPDLTTDQQAFVGRSRAAIRRRERAELRGRQLRYALLATAALVAVFAAIRYWQNAQQSAADAARLSRENAALSKSEALSAASRVLTESQPDLAALLALAAHRVHPTSSARLALLGLLERNLQLRTFLSTPGIITNIAASADGRVVAATYGDSVSIWDVSTFQELGPLKLVLPDVEHPSIKMLAISPDHQRLAAALDGPNNTVAVWSLATGQLIGPPITAVSPHATLTFAGADRLVSVGFTGTVRTFDLTAVTLPAGVATRSLAHGNAAFSPDGTKLAIFGCAPLESIKCTLGEVEMWDLTTGRVLWSDSDALPGRVEAVAFNSSGNLFAAGTANGDAIVWAKAGTGGEEVLQRVRIARPITGLAFAPDSTLLAISGCATTPVASDACPSTSITVHDIATGRVVAPVIANQPGRVTGLLFLPNGSLLASARGSAVSIWDPLAVQQSGSGTRAAGVLLPGNHRAVSGCARRSQTDPTAGCLEGIVSIVDAQSGRPTQRPLTLQTNVVGLVPSVDGSLLAVADGKGGVTMWDWAGDRVQELPLDRGSTFSALAFSTGNVVAAAREQDIVLWSVPPGGQPSAPRSLPRAGGVPVTAIAFNPAGDILAVGSRDGTVALLDVALGTTIRAPLTGHFGAVATLAFSSDSHFLASASADQTTVLWDVATGSPVGVPLPTGPVSSVSFDGDGQHLHTSAGQIVTSWPIPLTWEQAEERTCELAHRNLSVSELAEFDIPELPLLCPALSS